MGVRGKPDQYWCALDRTWLVLKVDESLAFLDGGRALVTSVMSSRSNT